MTHSTLAFLLIATLFIVLAKCLRMNMADLIGNICTDLTTASKTTTPVLVRRINENLRGAMPAIARVARDGVQGNVTVYGVNLPNPWANRANTQCLLGTGANAASGGSNTIALALTDYQFSLDTLPYVAVSNNNWIVLLNDVDEYVVPPGAAIGFTVSNPSSTIARIDFGTQTLSGDGATTAFTTTLDGGMLTYCDLVVKVTAAVKTITTDYALTIVAGVIVVTFVAAPPNVASNIVLQLVPKKSTRIGVIYAPNPKTLVPTGTNMQFYDEIVCKDAVWVVTDAGTHDKTDVSILPRL